MKDPCEVTPFFPDITCKCEWEIGIPGRLVDVVYFDLVEFQSI